MIISKKKICSKCKENLEIKYFSKDKQKRDGLCSRCKYCASNYYNKNKERIKRINEKWRESNEERMKIHQKNYYKIHRDEIKEKRKIYYRNNIDKKKLYVESRKPIRNKLRKLRRKNDINYRLTENLRVRINNALKGKSKSESTINLIGCSINQLKEHIESHFTNGMSWDNYGKWHIDHIIPCNSFNLLIEEEQKKCFNFNNLQPLWASDNCKKWAKRGVIYNNI